MVSLSEILRLLPDAKKNNARTWAGYQVEYLPLAASAANVKQSTTTEDDSDFIVTRIKLYATTDAAPPVETATPQVVLQFQIGSLLLFPDGNNQHGQNFAVSSGDRRGHVLEYPVYVPAQTTLNAFVTNLTATAMQLRIAFYRMRILDYPQSTKRI